MHIHRFFDSLNMASSSFSSIDSRSGYAYEQLNKELVRIKSINWAAYRQPEKDIRCVITSKLRHLPSFNTNDVLHHMWQFTRKQYHSLIVKEVLKQYRDDHKVLVGVAEDAFACNRLGEFYFDPDSSFHTESSAFQPIQEFSPPPPSAPIISVLATSAVPVPFESIVHDFFDEKAEERHAELESLEKSREWKFRIEIDGEDVVIRLDRKKLLEILTKGEK